MNSHCDIQICVESKTIATSAHPHHREGRYKFNYMKVINMYRGESMKRDVQRDVCFMFRLDIFYSCTDFLFPFYILIRSNMLSKEHLSYDVTSYHKII